MKIQMVDLQSQYKRIKDEIDTAVIKCMESAAFINGPEVKSFSKNLAEYLQTNYVVPCANGTDALQLALMALDLKEGDEIIVPTFTYAATAEVIALLNFKPVMADVDPKTFNLSVEEVEKRFTKKTKAIVPVNLYGQSADLEPILDYAKLKGLAVVKDNAQAIGAEYTFQNGKVKKTGTMGDIGTFSFFPSKNLGCYGDGGAVCTDNEEIASRLRMIANHGQKKKYFHSVIGVNSRLDSIQAAILNIKLKHLDAYAQARQDVAKYYDTQFESINQICTPVRFDKSSHVFHQYTLKCLDGSRDALKKYLEEKDIPSMIYYPLPLYKQEAFFNPTIDPSSFPVTNKLCEQVISLPIHTEMQPDILNYICDTVKAFYH